MTLLGLDLGERRIGLALSDPLGITARPLSVLECVSLGEDVRAVGELVARHRAQAVVVGLPLSMDGAAGAAARRARRFARALGRALAVPVHLWDERLTTAQAERDLLAAGQRRTARRQIRDAVAAALILQSYLDSHRQENAS